MTNTKTTKRALFASVLSLLLCISMLVGSTFAWFTDSATTGVNKIQAGTLDIVLEKYDAATNTWVDAEGMTLDFQKAEGHEGDEILWEPGCTYTLPQLRLRNNGDLWLKYEIAITGIEGDAKLNEAIEWTFSGGKGQGAIAPESNTESITITGHMKEEAGNEYQGLSIDGISITVFATQCTYEYDSYDNQYDANAPQMIMIGEETYETLAEAIAAANDGDTIMLAGKYTLPNIANKTLTFDVIKDNTAVIDMSNAINASGSTLTFNNMALNFDNDNYEGLQHAAAVNYNNCSFTGKQFLYATTVFTNCTFENYGDYCVWTYGADATFTGCTFTTGGKAILVYNEATTDDTVTVTDCTFNSNGQIATDKAAVETGVNVYNAEAAANSKHTIIINNSTANGFATNNSTSPLWGNKNSMDNEHLNVVIDGNSMNTTAPTVAVIKTAEELKAVLAAGTDAGAGNYVVNIEANIDLTGETWTPYTVDGYNGADVITINGNGHTITGLSAPLFAGGFAGGSGIVINELTIKDSTIVSTNTQGSGAFIECVDSMAVITLNKCHLLDSTVNGSRTGGLIGWTSGYNNTNDGAVKTYVTVKDCSVVGCTIETTFNDEGNTPPTESVGAIFGHAGANPWTFTTIENCVIENNTLIGGNGKTGVILGTANLGEVTITGCTIEGNTVNGAASDAVYGRTSFGTTGKLTIDGVEVN